MNSEASPDPRVHGPNIEKQIEDLVRHVRADAGRVHDAGFRTLLETTADVLLGLKAAYRHHGQHLAHGAAPHTSDTLLATEDRAQFYKSHLSPH